MRILLASPHGFCAGVIMALKTVQRALEMLGPPLYVFHEIVHNKHLVDRLRRQGVVFVESVADVPAGEHLVFSAHGVSPEVRRQARQRQLLTIDATCPLVAKVHIEAARFARHGYTIVLVGHAGHDEVVGTLGEAPDRMVLVETPDDVQRLDLDPSSRIAYLTQTTLSVDDANRVIAALRRRFPGIVGPRKEDICYATQNRQEAVRELVPEADLVLVVGSRNSSNSIRLVDIAREWGAPARLIDDVTAIDPAWFEGAETIVLTAGASAPEDLVNECLDWLCSTFQAEVEHRALREENVVFSLPLAVRSDL